MSKFKIIYKHVICVLILLGFLSLSVFVYRDVFFRMLEAFRDFGTSFVYYFCALFFIKQNVTPTITIMPSLDIDIPLPDNWTSAISKSAIYWKSMLSGETYSRYFLGVGQGFASFCQIVLLALPLFFLVGYLFNRAISSPNNDYNKDSRPLKIYKAVSRVIFKPVCDWVRSFVEFIKDTGRGKWRGFYWKIGLIIWLYNLNVMTILVELVAFLFYFFSSFDFATLYIQVYRLVLDLSLLFRALPWYVWLPVILPIIQHLRHRYALKRQYVHESHNKVLRDNLPVASLIVGSMGGGKTLHLTDFELSFECDFREHARESMQNCDSKFPDFPWINFERAIQLAMEKGAIFNLASARLQVQNWEYEFCNAPSRATCFDYDYTHYKIEHNDGLTVATLFDVLKIYAQEYFIYIIQSSLIISNFSIRTDGQLCDAGNLPIWDFDFFTRDPALIDAQSRHSHILSWDILRLGEKFLPKDPLTNSLEFGLFAITEFTKDRGNQYETAGLKKTGQGVNQKNDRFNWTLKTCRHAATVDNFPYIKFISDDQREDSAPADLVQLMTIVSIGREKKRGLTFPLFSLEGLIFDLYYFWFVPKYTQYRYSRGDNTLLMYLLHKLAAFTHGYVSRISNQYGYSQTTLELTDGKTQLAIDKHKYFLADKKIFSRRFDTACYRDFFSRRALASGKGINDIPEYSTETATLDELRKQQSYMIFQIDAATDKDVKK